MHAEAGLFGYDTMTLVGPGTWEAARGGRRRALTAVDLVAGGEPARRTRSAARPATTRPRSAYGGSCYLNNAAVAAEALRDAGHDRVAVVDIDAHHGNGTQAIFYDRADVLYGSRARRPRRGLVPALRRARRRDRRRRRARAPTATCRSPPGTGDAGWLEARASARRVVAAHGADALVVSLGVDAAADDPESPLQVTARRLPRAGRLLGALGLPTVAGAGGRLPPRHARPAGRGDPGRTRRFWLTGPAPAPCGRVLV